MTGWRPVPATLFERLLAGMRRQPVLAIGLILGLAITFVLAIPWFGGRELGSHEAPAVAGVEARGPEPVPAPETEAGETAEPELEPEPTEAREASPAPEPAPTAAPVIPGGVASDLPEIRALGPEHVGATTSASPSLYWFLSGTSPVAVEIRLVSEAAGETLFERRIEPPVGAGLHALRLASAGVRLTPGATCRWSVALVPDPANREADLVSGAAIRVAEASGSVAEQLGSAPPAERAHALAAAGYWYDAFDTLTRRIQEDPASEPLREQRGALLEQVGLSGVAALLPAPVPR